MLIEMNPICTYTVYIYIDTISANGTHTFTDGFMITLLRLITNWQRHKGVNSNPSEIYREHKITTIQTHYFFFFFLLSEKIGFSTSPAAFYHLCDCSRTGEIISVR